MYKRSPARFPDCRHYSKCLDAAVRQDHPLACAGCRQYEPEIDCHPSTPDLVGLLALCRAIAVEHSYTDQTPQTLIYEIKAALFNGNPFLDESLTN